MNAPRTLLSFAGAPVHPSPFDRAALVIVDAQAEYLPSGNLPLPGVDAAVAETARLLDTLGGVVPAAELQRNELAALADLFAVVVKDSGAWA